MNLLYRGKTKDVYEDGPNTVKMLFTDRVTQNLQGEIDPGGNAVADVQLPGNGLACLRMTSTIFQELKTRGINVHMDCFDLNEVSMIARKAALFKPGLEWVARWVGTGSFIRRYGCVPGLKDGMRFAEPVFEITLKDDAGQDPLIVPSAIIAVGIMGKSDMDALLAANENAMGMIREMFESRGLDLWDIKIEWGKDAETGKIMLIDEVSPGCCRAFDKKTGERVTGMKLADYFKAV
ncbi:phosphoribosylaminoimidazolesuccinocarboxamide synthase [Desulfovibrio sp. OttesenSCG-928-C14]|nr:phosphoribosylaminoimidazolesuccinocarboxamide synthase [Desulfovibrio sp. OttesenSCG-928-C14]